MPDRTFVCSECGHFWNAPEHPGRCESCGRPSLRAFDHIDAAEHYSQAVCDRNAGFERDDD